MTYSFQFIAGVFLSFGGLLSEIVGGGSAGLNASNPGLVKLLSGFVFPVGLVMYALVPPVVCIWPNFLMQRIGLSYRVRSFSRAI